jgi:protein subunit release factor A
LSLDQDTFYSNTDYVHDKAGQTKLADEQQQINVKQQELDVLKARLQDLEARKKPSGETPAPKQ